MAELALADDAQSRLALLEAKGLSVAASSVTVSTIHASKGLEFPYVFIVGCSEGLIPYGASIAGEALEEERRLLYVGVTRAEDGLHMSYARAKDEAPVPIASPAASSADPRHMSRARWRGTRHVW